MNLLIQDSSAEEGRSLTDALLRARDMAAIEYCYFLYHFIGEHSTNAEYASKKLDAQRDLLANDPNRVSELRSELDWLPWE
jgi:hypothetical protein